MHPLRAKSNLYGLGVNSQAMRDCTESGLRHLSNAEELSQETNGNNKASVCFSQQQRAGGTIHYLGFMLIIHKLIV